MMKTPPVSGPMTKYPCSSLPECAWLWSNGEMRDELLAATQDAQARSARARELVTLHVLKRIPYRGGGSAFLLGLLNKGYTREAVAQALAEAWLAGHDHFELPRRSRWAWMHTLWAHLGVSLVVTTALMVLALKVMAHTYPLVDAYLLTFPPLLAIIAFALIFPVFQIVKHLLGEGTSAPAPDDKVRAGP